MKKGLLMMCLCCTLFSCNDTEKKAEEKLQAARHAFEQGSYNEAKILIDSIKTLYPKAFDVRRAGIGLMQEIELKEQERSLLYLDSMLQAKQQVFDAIKSKYVFEKDAEYQNIGHYLHPSQVIEKNLHRSFLRFQVDENGIMSMTSIYCGFRNIHHIAVKVIAPDGSFAETPASKDSYETTDLGETIEKADYKMGEDGNVMGFLYLNKDKNIKIQYQGERPYSTAMSPTDRQALADVYELAQLLSSISEIKKNMEEANLKIGFVKRKMEEREKKNYYCPLNHNYLLPTR
ncbi:hypothetical protein [Bacteroides heparinolyticus]|uniref:hypothetical protein n=1 Tax=Prevotella heparinolytica TaxID=28113 RepID=UPI0023F6CBB2|nr:hypothetical protein [Bacteroides heparinolyticus]MCI6213183.1 hypothetical protein [Bacteroides heparinolyticus]